MTTTKHSTNLRGKIKLIPLLESLAAKGYLNNDRFKLLLFYAQTI